jgi:hypothetical protein
MHIAIRTTSVLTLLGALGAVEVTKAAVEEQVVGPADPASQIVVSERGAHLAAVVRKGSKWTVTVDGTAGPRVDEVLRASSAWIDFRHLPNGPIGISAGRHSTDQQTTAGSVVFCRDGSHYAYVARLSQEWVLMEDTKELLRLPVSAQNFSNDFRLQFTSDDGKHLIFARGGYYGFAVWVDGQPWPGFYASTGSGVDSTDPLISPDGEHIAYPAQIDREHRALIIDGKPAGYLAEKLTYTDDSKHLVGVAQGPKGSALLVDGKSMFNAQQILTYVVAPKTHRIAAVLLHKYSDGSPGQFVLLDGKPVEATLCKNAVQKVIFSPDGKHYAAVCSNAMNINYVVTDGKKGDEYDAVGTPGMPSYGGGFAFSPDSSRLLYVAHGGGKYFFVVNGEESNDAFDGTAGFCFSSDGKRLAYCGLTTATGQITMVVDGKKDRAERNLNIDQFDFSPDGSRYAYIALSNYGGPIYVDGQPVPVNAMKFVFSPDGKHLAISGSRPTDNRPGLWLDGAMVFKSERTPDFIAFSADSQHLFWKVVEPDKDKPGYWNNVTYADGKPVARSDNTGVYGQVTVPVGYNQYTIHPGWQPSGESGLVCLGPVGDDVKRYTITPTDTSLATLLAAAKP